MLFEWITAAEGLQVNFNIPDTISDALREALQ
jgi:hypothetical protein